MMVMPRKKSSEHSLPADGRCAVSELAVDGTAVVAMGFLLPVKVNQHQPLEGHWVLWINPKKRILF